MTGYKVVHAFADSQDGGYVYRTGDTYPREGLEPSDLRIADLASTANALGFPVIEKIEEQPKPAAAKKSEGTAKSTKTRTAKAKA